MFVEIWAMAMMIMATINSSGVFSASLVTRSTGSQTASPKTTMVAAVTAIPIKEKAVIVSGRPRAWPRICERCVFA
jgi:hypothetical protein